MKKKSILNFTIIFTLFLFLCSVNSNAFGQQRAIVTWEGDDGTNPTDWATDANWDTGNVPTSSDDVIIPGGLTNYPNIVGTANCNSLTIIGTGASGFAASTSTDVAADLSVVADVTVGSSTEPGTFNVYGGTVSIGGDLKSGANSAFDLYAGSISIDGSWTDDTGGNARGDIMLGGDITITIAHDCKFHAAANGTMDNTFTMSIGGDFSNNEDTWSADGGTITLTAAHTGTAEVYSVTAYPITAYNLVIDDGSSARIFNLARSGANTGIYIVNDFTIISGFVETKVAASPANHLSSFTVGGTFSIGSTDANFKNALETGDTYSVNTHSLHSTSNYWYYGKNAAQTLYSLNYGNLIFAGDQISPVNSQLTIANNLNFYDGADITLTTSGDIDVVNSNIGGGADFTINGGTFDVSSNLTMNHDVSIANNFTISGGTATIGTGGSLYNFSMKNPSSTFTVNGGNFICNGNFLDYSATYGAIGDIYFTGGTVDLNGYFYIDPTWGHLYINGATVNYGGPEIYMNDDVFTMTSGSLNFDGSGLQEVKEYTAGKDNWAFTDVNITNTAALVKVYGNVTTTGAIVVDPLAAFTVGGNLNTSGGALTVKSTSAGTGSLIVEGTATGNVTVERFLTNDRWHYISEPVYDTRNFNGFLGLVTTGSGSDIDQFYWWDEDGVDNSNTGTWFDILNATTGVTYSGGSFNPAQGYAINYGVATTDQTISFSGVPFFETKSIVISKSDGSTNEGANLVGNPFTSTIAINSGAQTTNNFIDENATAIDDGYEAVYLWDEQSDWVYPGNDYRIISNSSDATYAAPGQAFMVVAASDGATIDFNQTIQKHGSATFYKDAKQDEVPRFYMNVENDEGLYNEILIAFIDGMTKGLDPSYDAGKLKGNPNIALYTKLVEDNGIDFAHQALPPLDDEVVRVKTGLDVSTAGNYTFKINELQNFDEAISIKLEDKLTGSLIDFRQDGEYSFFINTPGEIRERFVLHFNGVTGIEDDEQITEATIQTYGFNNTLYILNPEMKQGTVTIYNLTGQKVATFKLTEDTKQQQTLNAIDAINVVKIQTGNGVLSQKVIFR